MDWPYYSPAGPTNYDAAPDGRCIALKSVEQGEPVEPRLVFVERWAELERKRRAAGGSTGPPARAVAEP